VEREATCRRDELMNRNTSLEQPTREQWDIFLNVVLLELYGTSPKEVEMTKKRMEAKRQFLASKNEVDHKALATGWMVVACQLAAKYDKRMKSTKKRGPTPKSKDMIWWDDLDILVRIAAYKHETGLNVTEALQDAFDGEIEGVEKFSSRTFDDIRARNKSFWDTLLAHPTYPASMMENLPYW
jgi:hypothetical protein